MIGYGRQNITPEDINAVVEVLKSDFLTQGPQIEIFEAGVLDICGAAYAVAANSATSALHMAYAALGIGPDSLVWTVPNTFVATANAAIYLGASVDFVDIDTHTYNMCPNLLERKLKAAQDSGAPIPDLVVPVHFGGQSCDMRAIAELGKKYGFRIVEDASHAIGGSAYGVPIGQCAHSDIVVFSFHPVKVVTTAEGGLATTNSPELHRKMASFRSHGITRDKALMTLNEGPWWYEMQELGFNYRMTDMQAALGSSQLCRLHDFVARRHEIAAYYDECFKSLPIVTPLRQDWQYSGFHLYVIRWPEGTGGLDRRGALEEMRAQGLGVNVHYIPVHLQPFYAQKGFVRGDFPHSEAYYDEAITIPLHPSLTDEEIGKVVETVVSLAQG